MERAAELLSAIGPRIRPTIIGATGRPHRIRKPEDAEHTEQAQLERGRFAERAMVANTRIPAYSRVRDPIGDQRPDQRQVQH